MLLFKRKYYVDLLELKTEPPWREATCLKYELQQQYIKIHFLPHREHSRLHYKDQTVNAEQRNNCDLIQESNKLINFQVRHHRCVLQIKYYIYIYNQLSKHNKLLLHCIYNMFYNYMFRPFLQAIVRLYLLSLESNVSYIKICIQDTLFYFYI